MKKICIFKFDLFEIGGAENVSVKLANELSKEYEVHFVSITYSKKALSFFKFNSIVNHVHFIEGKYNIYKTLIKGVWNLRRYLIKYKFDIIISIGISSNIFMSLSTLFLKINKIFCEHGNKLQNPTKLSVINRLFGVIFSNKIITLTEEDRQYYIKSYKFLKKENIIVIPNWIEDSKYLQPYDPDSSKILTVGRISREKGYDLLEKIIPIVLKENPSYTWDIFGSGDLVQINRMKEIFKNSGILERVSFKGNVSGIENIDPGHSLFVLTSYMEGLPLVLLEAQQYSIPIISFDCPTGPSDIIINEHNGILTKSYDINEMIVGINKILKDKDYRIGLSRNSKFTVDKFKKSKIINKWKQIIES